MATEMISSVAGEEISSVAAEEISSVAVEVILCLFWKRFHTINLPPGICQMRTLPLALPL